MHGHAPSDALLSINLIGFTAGFLIAALLLGLTLRAARLPGTPRANIFFALCGLVWNAGGLLQSFAFISGSVNRGTVLAIAGSAHFSGAVLWPLPILAIWRSFAPLPWQRTAGRVLAIAANVSAGAISVGLWTGLLSGRHAIVDVLFSLAIYYVSTVLLLGAAICLRPATTPRAVYISSWVIVAAVAVAALGFAAGGHITVRGPHSDSLIAAAQQIPLLIVLSGFFLFSRFRFGDIFIRYSVRIWLAALAATLLAVAAQIHHPHMAMSPEFPALRVYLITLLAGALLLSFTFVEDRLSRTLYRWFFHTADYRVAARELGEKLSRMQDEPEVAAAVEANARKTLELSGARLVAAESLPPAGWSGSLHDGEIVELDTGTRRKAMPIPGVELIVPVASGGRISHLLLVAPSTARPGLVTQELNYLRTIAAQCGQRLDMLRESVLLKQITEAELRALRSQINPHFLFNSLNTIADLIVRDPPRAEAMTLRLAGVFRHVLANTSRPLTSVRDEMDFLRTYLSIEEARFGDRLRVAFDVQPEAAGAQIPSLILQPLVENALRHGLAPKPGPVQLRISARAGNGNVCLCVQDDGIGLKPSQPRGTGLTNVAERLCTLYQDRAQLSLEPGMSGGTSATIVIPRHEGEAA